MRLGLGVSENLPIAVQMQLARQTEEAGLASLWTNESRGRDALVVAHAWSLATERLQVGTGIVPIWTRSVPQLAMAAAAIQDSSDGRLLLGIGVSHPATMGSWHGVSYRSPLVAARETLDLLELLFAGGETDHDGDVWSSRRFGLDITPLPPGPKVYLAAMGPKMLSIAGEHAHGVLLNWSSPEETSRAASRARASAARSARGRKPADLDVASYVRFAVSDDRDAAKLALGAEIASYCALPAYAAHFARQGFDRGVEEIKQAYRTGGAEAAAAAVPERMLLALGWYGAPGDDPAQLVARYDAAGLDHLVARVVVVGDDPAQSVRDAVELLRGHPSATPEDL